MDTRQLFIDIATLNFKSIGLRLNKLISVIKRSVIMPFTANFQNGKDIKDIPVIINNRNRYTYLLQLIGWLEKNGYTNIHIIDNDSTYPQLLDYYSNTKHSIHRLKENVGHLALWKTGLIKQFQKDYYIYTDPDVLPIDECPGNVISFFMEQLNKYPHVEKVGFGLKIDDLPDCYIHKKEVIDWENKFWQKQIAENLYDAQIDTTFALYRPYTNGAIWVQRSLRTGGKYIAQHLPWYEDSFNPTEENLYYTTNIRQGASHWHAKG
jgi:hypothetical protein